MTEPNAISPTGTLLRLTLAVLLLLGASACNSGGGGTGELKWDDANWDDANWA